MLSHLICPWNESHLEDSRTGDKGSQDFIWHQDASNQKVYGRLTITTESHIQAGWILGSQYLVLRKGKILPHLDLRIQGEDIPNIIDNPIKCLGEWFGATLKDKEAINQLQVRLSQNLKTIDKT
jgi:hypothetical protein